MIVLTIRMPGFSMAVNLKDAALNPIIDLSGRHILKDEERLKEDADRRTAAEEWARHAPPRQPEYLGYE